MRVIIIGAGKVGYKLAEKLSQENHEVLIIEQNEDRRKILQENLDVLVSGGNGASPRVLADAGVTHSDLLVAVTDQDEVNMLACMVPNAPVSVARWPGSAVRNTCKRIRLCFGSGWGSTS